MRTYGAISNYRNNNDRTQYNKISTTCANRKYKDSADRKRNRAETVVRAAFYTRELIYLSDINISYLDKSKETFFNEMLYIETRLVFLSTHF